MDSPRFKNALISVSDKAGLVEFAQGLVAAGVTIFSTGGTRRHLEEAGISVRDVSDYTGFPEMMDGRLKTLHPKVFGGLLARHDRPDDMAGLAEHGIVTFELVVVNLYPFEQTIAREGVTLSEAIEQIDIGGPSLVRAAAKNHRFTTIATDARQYPAILEEVTATGATTEQLRRRLAGEAFARTAAYDRAIADYFSEQEQAKASEPGFPAVISLQLRRVETLRYGENPHQRGALYATGGAHGASLVTAEKLSGKELSYNNLLDLDSALTIARSLPGAATSVIKHNNPCGAATGSTLADATRKALAGDPVSAFGSVLGMNQPVDAETAELLAEPGLFIEAIVAPDFSPEALDILKTRPKWKSNVRLMRTGPLSIPPVEQQLRWIEGGVLVQDGDTGIDPEDEWCVVTDTEPDAAMMDDLRVAWTLVRHVKSNAIVLCADGALLGAGAGQMSRVDSVEIAIRKAGERTAGSVLGSDAFFPFADSIQAAAEAGIRGIIQPGGSRRDAEVINACNEHKIAMVFTSRRHFKH